MVGPGEFDAVAGGVLRCLGETADLGAVLLVGCGDMDGEQMAERFHGDVDLGALLAPGPVIAGAGTALERRGGVRLSRIAAVGPPLR